MLTISGRIHDLTNKPLPEAVRVDAFEESVLGSRFDRHLGQVVADDGGDGRFAITVEISLGVNVRKIYFIIADPQMRFASVRTGETESAAIVDQHGKRKWKSFIVDDDDDDVENIDITVSLQSRPIPNDRYEAVVIGSGFGGSIVALTLANKYAEEEGPPTPSNRVCVIERGQWWVSPEIPTAAAGTTDGKPTIREYLERHNVPYGTWATPDDLAGFLRVMGSSRNLNPVKGVYDFRTMKNVSTISASGVGGGSLIYFNLTARPDTSTYEHWAIQSGNDRPLDRRYSFREVYGGEAAAAGGEASHEDDSITEDDNEKKKLLDYFDIAENFLGVNRITTTAALGRYMLPKSRVFQQAAAEIDVSVGDLMNPGDLSASLSITDVPHGIFEASNNDPRKTTDQAARQQLSWQTNVCQREGRCGLGCISDARHTMSQRLYEAINDEKPIDVFALCPVDSIEEENTTTGTGDDGFRYNVHFTDFRDDPKGVPRTIRAKVVVLAAGSLGSTEILLRSKNLRKSGAIGKRFSTNGDTFGVVSPTREVVDAGRGPLLTSIARYKDKRTGAHEFSLEDLGVPKMFAEVLPPLFSVMTLQKKVDSIIPQTNLGDMFKRHVMEKVTADPRAGSELLQVVEGLGVYSSRVLTEVIAKVREGMDDIIKPNGGMMRAKVPPQNAPDEPLRNVMALFGMGRDDSSLARLVVDGELTLEEPYDLEQPVYGEIVDRMKLFARKLGGDGEEGNLTMLFWDERTKLALTAHPLGGCPMGNDASEGVVDGLGRVYAAESGNLRHEGLYVADGSIIPTSLGVNPSLTICAVAFRIAEEIAGDKRFWPRH